MKCCVLGLAVLSNVHDCGPQQLVQTMHQCKNLLKFQNHESPKYTGQVKKGPVFEGLMLPEYVSNAISQ